MSRSQIPDRPPQKREDTPVWKQPQSWLIVMGVGLFAVGMIVTFGVPAIDLAGTDAPADDGTSDGGSDAGEDAAAGDDGESGEDGGTDEESEQADDGGDESTDGDGGGPKWISNRTRRADGPTRARTVRCSAVTAATEAALPTKAGIPAVTTAMEPTVPTGTRTTRRATDRTGTAPQRVREATEAGKPR
ncbi:hypothetical protein [Halalkalicoccus salilacus]|uniref:hypothetical protein n=1 Tax=Halalkalicoccus sp. GCM10025704 TaxID=3252662 RepID=UPI003621B2D5